MTLCVYAIASDGHVPAVSGARLRAIGNGRVWAIVAPARRTPVPSATRLRQHHRIVAALADTSAAVLPVRFGTIMDEEELMVVLRARRSALVSALRHVRGQVQMTVRLLDQDGTPVRPRTGAPGTRRQSGAAYLRERAAASSSRRIPGFGPVRDALDRWVRDERVERTQRVTSVYHLIPRRAAHAYVQAATAALDGTGLRVAVSGPFPPYAFTSW